ncbi:extracellular superoxide dismutase [Cu-Zn] [Erinaceus europaeus]|uniref:Superoxide dismutase [Cu-Zn] n=1 Tax=Erinaceus europaeus TaxID=9365 RepID=A0ABM3X5Z6_ERIEU|nr:extracellular superoxide dismutase [Cu-Zn] [Erinaceus europaeus]
MLALLWVGLLLAPGAWARSLSTVEQIRDTHAKVTELWQGLRRRWGEGLGDNTSLHACCAMQPSRSLQPGQPHVTGQVLFRQLQPGAGLDAYFDLEGFPEEMSGLGRPIHVHHFGDVSQGCQAAGGHYNPLSVPHPGHPGDFGNFRVRDGRLRRLRANLTAALSGPHSILGRALVLHAGVDDLGRGGDPASLEHGNSGPRLACCVVSLCPAELWGNLQHRRGQQRGGGEGQAS